MKSKIYIEEEVENKDRRFGSSYSYIPAMTIDKNGNEIPALFTAYQIKEARLRAARNPEDVPENKTFWERLFGNG